MKRRVVLLVSLFVAIVVSAQSVGQKWLADARKGNVREMVQTGKSYYTGTNGLPKTRQKRCIGSKKRLMLEILKQC